MHGPSVTNIECEETTRGVLKRDETANGKEKEPGPKCRKDRRDPQGVETTADHPFQMGNRRPRRRDIGESTAPTPAPIPAPTPPKGCACHSALDKPGGIGAKCKIRKSQTELIRGYDDRYACMHLLP